MTKKNTGIIPHMFTHTAFLHYGIKFSFTNRETSDGHKIVRRTNTTPYISNNKYGKNIKGEFYNQKFKLPKNFLGDKIVVKNIEEIKLITVPEGEPAELSDDKVIDYLCKPRSYDVYKRINQIDTTMDLSSYLNELAVYNLNKQEDTKVKNETKITIFNLSIINPKWPQYDGNPMDCVIITRGYHSTQSNYEPYMSDDAINTQDYLEYLKTAYSAYKIYISFKGCDMDRVFNSIRTFILNNIKHSNINAYAPKFNLSLSSLMKNNNFVPKNIVMVDAREKRNSFRFIPLNKCPEPILQAFNNTVFERNCHYALDCIIKGFANDNECCLKSMIFKDGLEASMFNNIDPNTTKFCVTNREDHLKCLQRPSTRVFFVSGVKKLQASYEEMCKMFENEFVKEAKEIAEKENK